jgi:hypothetical protein
MRGSLLIITPTFQSSSLFVRKYILVLLGAGTAACNQDGFIAIYLRHTRKIKFIEK